MGLSEGTVQHDIAVSTSEFCISLKITKFLAAGLLHGRVHQQQVTPHWL